MPVFNVGGRVGPRHRFDLEGQVGSRDRADALPPPSLLVPLLPNGGTDSCLREVVWQAHTCEYVERNCHCMTLIHPQPPCATFDAEGPRQRDRECVMRELLQEAWVQSTPVLGHIESVLHAKGENMIRLMLTRRKARDLHQYLHGRHVRTAQYNEIS
jgi:hypothetical protein